MSNMWSCQVLKVKSRWGHRILILKSKSRYKSMTIWWSHIATEVIEFVTRVQWCDSSRNLWEQGTDFHSKWHEQTQYDIHTVLQNYRWTLCISCGASDWIGDTKKVFLLCHEIVADWSSRIRCILMKRPEEFGVVVSSWMSKQPCKRAAAVHCSCASRGMLMESEDRSVCVTHLLGVWWSAAHPPPWFSCQTLSKDPLIQNILGNGGALLWTRKWAGEGK